MTLVLLVITLMEFCLICFLSWLCMRFYALLGSDQSAWLQRLQEFNEVYNCRLDDLRRFFYQTVYSEEETNDNVPTDF